MLPALLGLAFVAAAWFAACRLGGRDAAAWTIAVLVGTTPLVRFDVELLSDLPSAACMLALVGVLVGELRDRPGWKIVACAPLAIAAVYVRYGSCVAVAIIGATALAFGHRAIRHRPWPVLVTAVVVVLAVLPLHHTLAVSAKVPPSTPGLVDYVTRPFWYFGALAPPLMLLALTTRDRWRRFAVIIGVADIVVLGLETAAQTRYVVLALGLLVAVGAAELRERLAGRRAPRYRVLHRRRRDLDRRADRGVHGPRPPGRGDCAHARRRRGDPARRGRQALRGDRAPLEAARVVQRMPRGQRADAGMRTYVARDGTGRFDVVQLAP